MSDPTIQTFCCYHANGSVFTSTVMKQFNTGAYNAVCIVSSFLGIFGAIYQILPRHQFSLNHRWLSNSANRGRRIIIWLAVADLLASLGVFCRALVWISYRNIMPTVNDQASMLFCAIASAWIQYFYTATWIWTLCYAIDMRLLLKQQPTKTAVYHAVAWVIPAILTGMGLLTLYYPDANCHNMTQTFPVAVLRILPNYIATYVPIALVMMANPYLYSCSSNDMERIIMCNSGQMTSRERATVDAIKLKFFFINFTFYVCWIANLMNGVLLWSLWFNMPVTLLITIWYFMAFLNPLQAFFNCLVYRRWDQRSETIVIPFRKYFNMCQMRTNPDDSSYVAPNSNRDENLPLLQSLPKNSINENSGSKWVK